ncbi:uncharacterized protein LOC123321021 [Coccinella septempunctata]|uniref:uncharacterized protein LOC123321021 n=1 Tax=Coccinella septempunctata TaxID=41139 RepID=UPI001D087ABF|nr:uncharacterized protein LOC123321021 [Coccinella septempunctata]
MGFFEDMRNIHGQQLVVNLKEYNNNLHKISNLKNRRIFLLRCREQMITPTHLQGCIKRLDSMIEFKDARTGQQVKEFNSKLGRKILTFQIDITIKNLRFLDSRQSVLDNSISDILSEHTWNEFKRKTTSKVNRAFHRNKEANRRKFESLESTQRKTIVTQDKWLKNLTGLQLPSEVKTFLSLGPKFSLVPQIRDIPIIELLATVETYNTSRNNNECNIIRAKVTNVITNHLQQSKSTGLPYITRLENSTKRFLREHPDIIVTQSDKGGVTVLMEKEKYINLANQQLGDQEYYQQISKDPTSTIEQKLNKKVSELKQKNYITPEEAKELMTYDGLCPKYYGLVKIHKPELSLRPIISSIGSPTTRISQFLKYILYRAYNFNNTYYIKDSFDFTQSINNFKVPPGYRIVSLDVVSLFTNITIETTKKAIEYNWQRIEQQCQIPKKEFMELIELVFSSIYFAFDGKFYRQCIGTPMGSKLSQIIADYVIDELLDECIPQLTFIIPFCKKYVDDLILMIPEGKQDEILNVFNSFHPKIQFTIEEESNNCVPFLDTKVIREDETIKTDWHRKTTASGRYIHYTSYHPMKMKINLILNLKTRITTISHPTYLDKNLKTLAELMEQNGYPRSLVRRLVFNTPNHHMHEQQMENTNNERPPREPPREENQNRKKIIILPHIEGLTHKITKLLSDDNTFIAKYNVKTSKYLYSKLKDTTPKERRPNVVYKIPCNNCSGVYIGETKRTMNKRITSHKSDSRRNIQACALAQHENTTGHHMKFSDLEILDTETNSWKRKFIEMIRITQEPNAINHKKDIDNLSAIYANLVEIDKMSRNRNPIQMDTDTDRRT